MNLRYLKRRQLIHLLIDRNYIRPPRMHQLRKEVLVNAVKQGLASHRYGAEMRREVARMIPEIHQ